MIINNNSDLREIFKDFEGDYKDQVIEVLEYQEFEDLKEWLGDGVNDSGGVDEIVDSLIDIYNYDLREWAVDNYGYIEEAIDEFGTPDKFDYHGAIQLGQYFYYSKYVNECIDSMVEYLGALDD